jgi:hypothetical protein
MGRERGARALEERLGMKKPAAGRAVVAADDVEAPPDEADV